jgi:hypothetical protein
LSGGPLECGPLECGPLECGPLEWGPLGLSPFNGGYHSNRALAQLPTSSSEVFQKK